MDKWDYRQELHHVLKRPNGTAMLDQEALDAYGDEGWEVVSTLPIAQMIVVHRETELGRAELVKTVQVLVLLKRRRQ